MSCSPLFNSGTCPETTSYPSSSSTSLSRLITSSLELNTATTPPEPSPTIAHPRRSSRLHRRINLAARSVCRVHVCVKRVSVYNKRSGWLPSPFVVTLPEYAAHGAEQHVEVERLLHVGACAKAPGPRLELRRGRDDDDRYRVAEVR